MREDIIAVSRYGEVEVHFKDRTGNYATLCGMDGNDNSNLVGQETVELPHGAKVNCDECARLFYYVRSLSASDIAAEHRVQLTSGGRAKNNGRVVSATRN